MDIITWGNIAFYVKTNEIKSIKDLTLDAKAETEDKTENGEKFVKLKNKGSYTVTMTAVLAKALNVDVKKTALELTEAARKGTTGYLYCGGSKLLSPQFMMTEAKVTDVVMDTKANWLSCEAALTLKQCSKGAGDGGGGGGGGSKGPWYYKVQIAGMGSEVKVKAYGIQDAITKAGVGTWTGTVYVNGRTYYVVKGKLAKTGEGEQPKNDDVDQAKKDQDQAKKDADQQSQDVYDDAHSKINKIPDRIAKKIMQ